MQTISVSSVSEAIKEARRIFAADSAVEWVVATGAATVGGAVEFGGDDLVLHRSERAAWRRGRSVEETQAAILAG